MIANEANLDATEVEMKTINHDFRDVEEVQEEVVRTKRQISKIQMKSECNHQEKGKYPELDNLNSKRQLLKLMIKVKFQRFGFKEPELDQHILEHIDKIQHLADVEPRNLNEISTGVFLDIFSSIIGQRSFLTRLLGVRGLQMQQQRQDQMQPNPRNNRMIEISSEQNNNNSGVIRQGAILCNICYSTVYRHVEDKCSHTFCVDCMKGYLKECLRTDTYFIKCPEYDCEEMLSVEIIKQLLSAKNFKRFLYFREKNQKELDPDNKFCSKPDCGQLLENRDDKLICPKCSSQFCEVCLQKYHGKQKCDVILKTALERTFSSLLIKKCPSCKSPIEKSDGCNHMTCKKCRHEFCWICMRKYSKHHYRYYNCFGCPGMLFEGEDDIYSQRMKQCGLYMLIPFILVVLLLCYVVILPAYMIGCLIINPCAWPNEKPDICEYRLAKCLCCSVECCSRIVAWFLLQPRAVLFAVFIAPIKITAMMCSEICEMFD